jgi:hypothetical protein
MVKYLGPINNNLSVLSKSQQVTNESVKETYTFIAYFRNAVIKITQKIFAVFANIVVEFQKILLSMKDIVARLVGIFTVFIYMFEASTDYLYPSINDAFDTALPPL